MSAPPHAAAVVLWRVSRFEVLAAEQRKQVAHGVSRGFAVFFGKPRQGRKPVAGNSFAPTGAWGTRIYPTTRAVGYRVAQLRCYVALGVWFRRWTLLGDLFTLAANLHGKG